MNNEAQVIQGGLEEGDRVYREIPAGLEEEPVTLLVSMNGKRKNNSSEKNAGTVDTAVATQ
jgi:hypothetical protein